VTGPNGHHFRSRGAPILWGAYKYPIPSKHRGSPLITTRAVPTSPLPRTPHKTRNGELPITCRNRHCPKCQALAQAKWVAGRLERILPTHYFHVVFTLPAELRDLARHGSTVLDLLFRTAADTLLALGRDPERLGAELGVTMVLHTWACDLRRHYHVHCIVTGGGLAQDDEHWISSRAQYLFPVQVMGELFRGKMLDALRHAHERGQLGTTDPQCFARLLSELYRKNWVVYCKRPFAGPESVLAYLANYTHRVAISERRIEHFDAAAGTVTFRYRDYAAGGVEKRETLPVATFVRRFCQHVLPRSFTKIRHYGLLANHARKKFIPQARAALVRQRRRAPPPAAPALWTPVCSRCGGAHPACVALLQPDGRVIELPALVRLTLRPRAPP